MSPFPQIDHLVIAGPNLADLSTWWTDEAGAPAVPGGAHTDRGTRNELAGIDPTTYVELIGPDPGQPDPAAPRPFGIDAITRRRLVTFAVAVDDLDQACAAVAATGIDPGPLTPMQRERPDGSVLAWRLAVPGDPSLGGVMPFLIEWADSEHPAASLPPTVALTTLELRHPKPARIASAIAAATGSTVDVTAGSAGLTARFTTASGSTFTITS